MEGVRIYGYRPVLEALEDPHEVPRALWVSRRRKRGLEALEEAAHRRGLRVERVDEGRLDAEASGGNHQGVMVVCAPFAYAGFETSADAVLEASREEGGRRALVLALDGVQDPMNLGAALRTAVACGAGLVVLPEHKAAGVTPTVLRASAGLARRVPVARVVNLGRALDALKAKGFWVAGACTRDGVAPWEADLKGPLVVVLGSEGRGMRRGVERRCDWRVTVPLAEGAESLNVAAAGAMLLYEAMRQERVASAENA